MNIWTDGSFVARHPNRPGGWGWIAEEKSIVIDRAGGSEAFANTERMELRAVVEALRWAYSRQARPRLTIITDSKDLIWGIHGRRSWPECNARLAQDAATLLDLYPARVTFAWVKGHRGERFNEEADRIAKRNRGRLIHRLQRAAWQGAYL